MLSISVDLDVDVDVMLDRLDGIELVCWYVGMLVYWYYVLCVTHY